MKWLKYIAVFVFAVVQHDHVFPQQQLSDLKVLLQNQYLPAGHSVLRLDEESDWEFSEAGKKEWKKASIPGCVHTDLLDAEELYHGDNEKKYQWIEEKNWEYKTGFRLGSEWLKNNYTRFELVFDQLDAYAKVYLNDHLIMEADNAFRTWNTDITNALKKDTSLNVLRVVFESAVNKGKSLMKQWPYTLPGDEKVYTRKAQYEYGWDWGPRFVTSGIRKPVYIIGMSERSAIIEQVIVKQQGQHENGGTASMQAQMIIHSGKDQSVYVSRDLSSKECIKVLLKKGKNEVVFPFTIHNAHDWYPRGYGESVFYPLKFTLHDQLPGKKKSKILSEKNTVYAFCKIDLVQEKDPYGQPFYFKVNGIPVFAKGVNLIPYDSFNEYYNDQQLKQIYDLHVNMVRVWGGGYYPSDEFYLYCLANGIMVWQDFMFACVMYPGDEKFVNNVKAEVHEQAIRLHPFRNIALWCGNNEIEEGWFNWGWQKQYKYSPADSTAIWDNYRKIFHEVIPAVLSSVETERVYHPSSPSNGWGRDKSLTEGDCHYWGVWWGKQPIDTFNYRVPRFMSEYGMQSMPAVEYMMKHVDLKGSEMDREVLASHQKHPTGFGTLDFYLEKYYIVPANIFHYVYASQLVQAYALQTAIEAHRRNRPKCMGTLLWQMNDCWPVVSWSLVDHDLHCKIAYQQVQTSFETMLLSVVENKETIEVYITSDSLGEVNDTVSFILYDFTGKALREVSSPVNVLPATSKVYLTVDKSSLGIYNPSRTYAVISLQKAGKSKRYHFAEPNQLQLEKPVLEAGIVKVNEICGENCLYEFRLSADRYCPDLTHYPQDDKHGLIYQDYISPGRPLVIRFWQEDYAYYKNLSQQPGTKFLYLQKLLEK